jgi:hypothetical protein
MATPSYDDYLKEHEEDNYESYSNEAYTVPDETLESKYAQPIYDVADKLKYFDKIRSATVGPVIQAVTGGHPVETIKKEYTSFEPQPESSFMGRFRELFHEQTPIMDTPVQDIAQGENYKAIAKSYVKEQFPKAYDFASGMVPSDIPGVAADEATMGLIPSPNKLNMANKLESAAELNREKGLHRISSLPDSDASKYANDLKTNKVANTLNKYGVANLISDPNKLNAELNGILEPSFDQFGRQVSKKVKPGIIDDLTTSVKMAAQSFDQTTGSVDASVIADQVYSALAGESGKQTSLVPFSQESSLALSKKINDALKTSNNKTDLKRYMPHLNTNLSFSDLIDIKRNAADAIYEIKNNPQSYGVQGPTDLKMYKNIWSWVDNHVTDMASKDKNMSSFVLANSDLSDMLTAKDMLAKAKSESLSAPSIGEVGMGIMGGAAIGQAAGVSPVLGASLGGGFTAARSIGRDIESSVPARVGNLQQSASDFLRARPGINPARDIGQIASAVNVPNINQQMMMSRPIVENLADFEIPRTSEEILKNKRLVLAKIAQVTNDPSIVNLLDDAFNKHPDKLGAILPALIANPAMTNIFRANKYQSWVNGKILDPIEVQKAYKDVNSRQISNTEKIILQDGLNRDGSFPESF